MDESDFYDLLAAHDWYYQYSDDHKYWVIGRNRMAAIKNVLKSNPELQGMYNEFFNFHNKQGPEPKKPEGYE